MESRIFQNSLIASLIIHIAVFVQISYSNLHYINKPVNRIEVTYQSSLPEPKKAQKTEKKIVKSIKQTKLPEPTKGLLKNRTQKLSPVKDISKQSEKLKIHSGLTEKLANIGKSRKINVPRVQSEKINNPVYLTYYDIVRNKIKEQAYINYSHQDVGQVYLTFVLVSSGTLKQLKLIDEKTSANQYLKNVGIRSVEDANPFPAFPKNLSYPELSFNVVISFEANE